MRPTHSFTPEKIDNAPIRSISVPFNAIQFSTYESVKQVLNPSGEYSPGSHMLAGAVAGGLAAAVTNPLDVAKTLLQTRGDSANQQIRETKGMAQAIKLIWTQKGPKGFFRGIAPRVIANAPSTSACWVVYELFKQVLTTKKTSTK